MMADTNSIVYQYLKPPEYKVIDSSDNAHKHTTVNDCHIIVAPPTGMFQEIIDVSVAPPTGMFHEMIDVSVAPSSSTLAYLIMLARL